jgi:hypothetical protein
MSLPVQRAGAHRARREVGPPWLSRALRVRTEDYPFHSWPANGLPANLESVMRALQSDFGADIRGLEWLRVLSTINRGALALSLN